MKALVGAFNQEKALVGAFSVIVQPVVEPMEHYTALVITRTITKTITVLSRLFQKVDQWMSKDEQQDNDARKKLEDANQVSIMSWSCNNRYTRVANLQENIQLKSLLGETQTNIAVLRSEMTQLKTNYETKVTELTT